MTFIVFSQLAEQQRLMLTHHLRTQNIELQNYTLEAVTGWMMEILCSAKSSIDEPTIREHRRGNFSRPRTFAGICTAW